MLERHSVVKQVVAELRELKDKSQYLPSADVDIVWAVSQPGTVFDVPKCGVYKGLLNDLMVVKSGIDVVKKVTALRLGIADIDVTEEVSLFGPLLYYNGEDLNTPGYNYLQNSDFELGLYSGAFPIPHSNVVIDSIEAMGTHS